MGKNIKLLFVVVLLLFLVPVIIFVNRTRGHINCETFIDKETNKTAFCGIQQLSDVNIEIGKYKRFAINGVLEKIFVWNNELYLDVKVPFNSNWFFRIRVKVAPTSEGLYQVSNERRKWIGYFDNNSVKYFSLDKINDIDLELKGKNIMVMMTLLTGDTRMNDWQIMIENSKRNIMSKMMISISGLLNKNIVDANQIGY